jgi:hypothetical protein
MRAAMKGAKMAATEATGPLLVSVTRGKELLGNLSHTKVYQLISNGTI